MARATKRSASSLGTTPWAKNLAQCGRARARRPCRAFADEDAGLLEGLAHRGQRHGAGTGRRHAARDFRKNVRREIAAGRHAIIAGIDAAAGKHIFSGHERHALVAPAHQQPRCIRVAPREHKRAGVLRAQHRGQDRLVVFVERGFQMHLEALFFFFTLALRAESSFPLRRAVADGLATVDARRQAARPGRVGLDQFRSAGRRLSGAASIIFTFR